MVPAKNSASPLRRTLLLLAVLLAAWLAAPLAVADDNADFLAAREAYRNGRIQLLPQYAQRLKDSVLLPYIQYWELSSRLQDASAEEIRAFIARNTDSPLSDRMRGEWLKLLGQKQDWAPLLAEYPLLVNGDVTLQCYALRGRIARGEILAQREGVALWFTGKDLPAACTPLFEQLLADGLISQEDIWRRFRLALEAGNPGVAKVVAGYLPRAQQPGASLIEAVTTSPDKFLAGRGLALDQRAERELALYAIARLARRDAQAAVQQWEKISAGFSQPDQRYMWGQLGLYGARQHLPGALGWFERAGEAGMNDGLLAWKTRAALRAGDWTAVQAAIAAMTDAARADPAWRYWLARAYKAQGKAYQANALLAPLSREHHFYGLLAEEELGTVLTAPAANFKVGSAEVEAIGRIPAIQRALLLYRMDLRSEANGEWVWATRNFDDQRLLAAAELARQHDWFDRAINTADRTQQLHDFELRFLAPYRDIARQYAKEYGLDEAWVYGLIRQESRFVARARSSAGAAGLMQVMPATARWIASKLGIRHFQADHIHRLDTNIQFGMFYLKSVQQSLDGSPVLATAAYNAGPGRARRWRSTTALEGAIYAESIPFTETRDYVKKVMSNATFYARSFGQPAPSLKERLGTIAAAAAAPLCGGEDENAPACEN